MTAMVGDTLKQHPLPPEFGEETVWRAVAQARKLFEEKELDQAEGVLRGTLAQAPDHPAVLKELARCLMLGRVYDEEHWALLPEIARHGRAVLRAEPDNDYICFELARTLLAIPAMPEAIEFLDAWIRRSGETLERLGMLAWARGCTADYVGAEATWEGLLSLADGAGPDDIRGHVPHACNALVDCLASAGEVGRARRVVRSGWRLCRGFGGEVVQWPWLFKQSGLDAEAEGAARHGLAAAEELPDTDRRLTASCCARVWIEAPDAVAADWLGWAREHTSPRERQEFSLALTDLARSCIRAGLLHELRRLATAACELVRHAPAPDFQHNDVCWSWRGWLVWSLIRAGDLEAAEQVAREGVAAGNACEVCWLNDIAIARGDPSPPALMQEIAAKGVEGSDCYDGDAWYHIAREAAAAGRREEAFGALQRACEEWRNAPLAAIELWEKDRRWGTLRQHQEFTRILNARRERIGPIHGLLHYFPGWERA